MRAFRVLPLAALGSALALAGCDDEMAPGSDGPLPQGTLVFAAAPDFDVEQQTIVRMGTDGSGRVPVSDFVGRVDGLEVSPDGGSLLFATDTDPGAPTSPSHLVRLYVDTGVTEEIPAGGDAWSGSWSPDGSMIAFGSGRTGHGNIFLMAADGSGVHALTDDQDYKGFLHWSPGGGAVAYENRHNGWPDRSTDLWVVSLPNGTPTPLVGLEDPLGGGFPTWCRNPRWSPDGSRLVFSGQTSTYGDEGGGLWVVDADGSGLRHIVPAAGSWPSWSPDGSWIVMSRSVVYQDPTESSLELFIVRPDGTGLRQLTATRDVDELYPVWLE